MDKIFEKLEERWTLEEISLMNVDQIKNEKLRKTISKSHARTSFGNAYRLIRVFRPMKLDYVFHKARILTAKLMATRGNVTCIYGYIYAIWLPDTKDKFEINYVCFGPTYRSMDGEYRNRIMPVEYFNQSVTENIKQFEIAEQYMLDRISNEDLDLHIDPYVHDEFKNKKGFINAINESRLPIKMLTAAWICDALDMKLHPGHVNKSYPEVIVGPYDSDVLNSMKLDKIQTDLTYIRDDPGGSEADKYTGSFAMGQKIFPLGLREITRREDINFSTWREIYISELASNCVVNYLSPSFPASSNWFYIQHNEPNLFDNETMHVKFNHSTIAGNIAEQLKHIDKLNYRRHEPINDKFFKLSRSIESSILLSDSELRLSDLALCLTNEYVGKTFATIVHMIATKEELTPPYMPTMGDTVPKLLKTDTHAQLKYVFSDHLVFTKHIFELIYGMLCIHRQVKIIHGDPHMNNVTIKNEVYTKQSLANHYVCYIVDGVPYVTPYTGLTSSFIDFSRGLIGDKERIIREFGPRFAEIFFRDQNGRILGLLYQQFPELVSKYRIEIESNLVLNFPLMFKIITAIDLYSVCQNMLYMIELSELFQSDKSSHKGHVISHPDNIKLMKSLSDEAEKIVIDGIERICKGQIKRQTDIEWPAVTLISKYFTSLTEINLKESDIIINIFSASNPIKYDIGDFDNMGPFLSHDTVQEAATAAGVNLIDLAESTLEKWKKYKKYDETDTVSHMIHQIEEQEQQNLKFEPWMLLM